ncbi:MAG: hypothetical protein LQ351_005106 [Letrouitia transgressa]|nr:MAG: hypothetical protein LQ351_005106 [Letrouitia transgressa]
MAGYNPYQQADHQPHGQASPYSQGQPSPGTQQFRPQVASPPLRHQQGGSPYGQVDPDGQHSQYGGTPYGGNQGRGTPQQNQGYFAPQNQAGVNNDSGIAGLTSQVGGMGLGNDTGAPHRPNKKKNRHAYHNLEQPASASQNPQGAPQSQFNYGNTDAGASHPYTGQQVTSAMNQFPAQAGAPFSPGQTPAPGFGSQPAPIPTASGPPVSAQGKVDPEQIPSIARARDAAAQYYLEHIYPTMEQHIPPPAAVPFVSYDQGNSSPKYARLTLNHIPSTSESLSATALPLGLILQPLAPLQEGEQAIPVLDFGESGPPRCRRCRTYINPFMIFRSGGNKLVCNMCTFPNDVPPDYFAPTDPSGVRVDRAQRPELTMGTVEFMVPREYWAKEPVGLHWLFLIDVGQEAINRGFLQAFCEGVKNALYGDDDEEAENKQENGDALGPRRRLPMGSKIGFVAFERAMYFFNCNAKLDQAQMLVMPDLEDPFVPVGSDGLFVDPYESKTVITGLLQRLPSLFQNQRAPEPALLPVLQSAQAALSSTGGKIVCSLAALPTWGPGRLFLRDKNDLHGMDTEKKLFQTEQSDWKRTANKLVESGVGVDFFLAAAGGGYMDVATIG